MEYKVKAATSTGMPNLGLGGIPGARGVDARELMRRKLMRKMTARRLRHAEMNAAK